jgi:3-oxoacyl-[acyl-carrier protein] reductase
MNILARNNYDVNHVVLISGGTSGIGLALVRLYRRLGFKVATFGKSLDGVLRLKKEFEYDHMIYIDKIDITDFESIVNFYQNTKSIFGNISILINNAAISGPFCPINEVSLVDISNTINTNLTAQIYLTSIVVSNMNNNGVIINISSDAHRGNAGGSLYSAVKAGINAFTRSIAMESNIRCFSYNPGHVNTKMQHFARLADYEKFPIGQKLNELYIRGMLVESENVAIYIAYISIFPENFVSGSFIQNEEIMINIENSKYSRL